MKPWLSALLSTHLLDRSGGHRQAVLTTAATAAAFDLADRAGVERERAACLADMLNHAAASVPRVRALLRGQGPFTAATAKEALRTMPPMRRPEIQADLQQFCAEGSAQERCDATGGSTGTPMVFRIDRATQVAREASLMWADGLAGWRLGERIAMLWGADRDVQQAHASWRGAMRLLVENRRWFNSFDMGPDRMAGYHSRMRAFNPHILVAYAGSLDVFARYLRERGEKPDYPRTAIISSAEVLAPAVRRRVEEVFPVRVFDRYGNREAGAIAAECACHDGLHVNESDFIVEIDSPDPVRQPGPLLITYLRNRAMPFLRYDTGDLACWMPEGRCACGRTTRRLRGIVGRVSDTIRTATGRLIHGEYFTHLMYGEAAVRDFQFVQHSLTSYRLLVTGERGALARQVGRWREELLAVVGADADIQVEIVDRIPVSSSGKRRFTRSEVTSG
jgi:phenylacetate-CoA ligase